jgi:hypothetical protein
MANAHISATFAAKVVREFASGANSAGPCNFARGIVLSIWLLLCEEGRVAFHEENALGELMMAPMKKTTAP